MKTNKQRRVFAQTCPLLLNEKRWDEPYVALEQFFSFSGLGGYRKELTEWFKSALSVGVKSKRASDLLFLHDQFVLLLQAAFVIAAKEVRYAPVSDHNGELFCDWLVESSYNNEDKDCAEHHAYNTPYWLEVRYREAPLSYLQKTLTIETVQYIRQGLHEWREAASSKHLCLVKLGRTYLFELYEMLQKITEACYLLLTNHRTLHRKTQLTSDISCL